MVDRTGPMIEIESLEDPARLAELELKRQERAKLFAEIRAAHQHTVLSERIITLEEVSKHDREDDAWTVIDGVVYDITHFVHNHPGGRTKIMRGAGKDSTEKFRKSHLGGDEIINEHLWMIAIGTLSV